MGKVVISFNRLKDGISIVDLIIESGLSTSRRIVRSNLNAGNFHLNGVAVREDFIVGPEHAKNDLLNISFHAKSGVIKHTFHCEKYNPLNDLPKRNPHEDEIISAEIKIRAAIHNAELEHRLTTPQLIRILAEFIRRRCGER